MTDMAVYEVGAGIAVLRPTGRLDLTAAPDLRDLVTATVQAGRSRVVIDLSGVAFMDSSGLGALIGALKIARQAGGDLRIADLGDQVATVMELTQMHRVLRAYDSVEQALDGL